MSKPPVASSAGVSARMARQATRDTGPELLLRRALHRMGLRYRVDYRAESELRRKADIVFTRAKVAVFVDGCFWHQCPEHRTVPRSNTEWWRNKLQGNVARDRDTDQKLTDCGWEVIRVWEHEDMGEVAQKVRSVVLARGNPGASP